MSYKNFTHSAQIKINHLLDQGGKIVEKNSDYVKIEVNLQIATIDVWGKVVWTTK